MESSHQPSHLLPPNHFPTLQAAGQNPSKNHLDTFVLDPVSHDPPPPNTAAAHLDASLPSNTNALPEPHLTAINKKDQSSLFKAMPKNAGLFKLSHFELIRDGALKHLRKQVQDESIKYWSNHVVGFFLDGTLSYLTVVTHLKRI